MTWGFLDDDIYITITSGLGVQKDEHKKGIGSQFWDFRCRAYRAKLIPSRVLQCAPTLGQPGILYL